MKYPGGYQVLDLKGFAITTTPTLVDDKELVAKCWAIHEGKIVKPVYLTGYILEDEHLVNIPLLMDYEPGAEVLIHSFYDEGYNPTLRGTIHIDCSQIEADGVIYIDYTIPKP